MSLIAIDMPSITRVQRWTSMEVSVLPSIQVLVSFDATTNDNLRPPGLDFAEKSVGFLSTLLSLIRRTHCPKPSNASFIYRLTRRSARQTSTKAIHNSSSKSKLIPRTIFVHSIPRIFVHYSPGILASRISSLPLTASSSSHLHSSVVGSCFELSWLISTAIANHGNYLSSESKDNSTWP